MEKAAAKFMIKPRTWFYLAVAALGKGMPFFDLHY
jgi:hypothetical protein